MDVDTFMGAQLWLRRLPPQAWPAPTLAAAASATAQRKKAHNACRHTLPAEDGPTGISNDDAHGSQAASRVILQHGRCCFLLEDRPSAGAAAEGGSDHASSAASEAAENADGSTGRNTATRGTGGGSGINAMSRCRLPRPLSLSASVSDTFANHGTNSRRDGSPPPEDAARERRAGQQTSRPNRGEKDASVDCAGFQENRCTAGVAGRCRPGGRSTATAASVEGQASVSIRQEFDFGLAIARRSTPSGEPEPDGGGGAGQTRAAGECGALLLRIEGEVYEAEHTLIRSIAYPRSDAGGRGRGGSRGDDAGTGDVRREAPPTRAPPGEAATGAVKPAGAPNDDKVVPNRGDGNDDVGCGKRGSPLPASGEVDAARPLRPLLGESTTAGSEVTGVKTSSDGFATDGAPGVTGERLEGGGKRRRFHGEGGDAGGAGRGATDAAAAAVAAEARASSVGGEGVEAGTPFCGLFFPGVLLRFWLPRRNGQSRAEVVATLQGVVNAMLAGLSPTPRCERATSSCDTASRELDRLVSSVAYLQHDGLSCRLWLCPGAPPCFDTAAVAEGQGTGFRLRYEAWNEFAYGSHFLLRQERVHRRPQDACDRSRRCRCHSNGDAGGPALWPSCSRRSGWTGIDAFALSGLAANGDSDTLSEGGVLSDVGRARALTSLAECFSRATLPPPVRMEVQQRLRVAATSASRELESTLDQAFPLDLSQETDSNTRVSMVSGLEASLRQVQQTRESLLAISILPTSDVLDESDSRSRV
ncbi:unnamed protein product [Scytosiphon promiscuus]